MKRVCACVYLGLLEARLVSSNHTGTEQDWLEKDRLSTLMMDWLAWPEDLLAVLQAFWLSWKPIGWVEELFRKDRANEGTSNISILGVFLLSLSFQVVTQLI